MLSMSIREVNARVLGKELNLQRAKDEMFETIQRLLADVTTLSGRIGNEVA